jgi:gamma-glutamyltranspeptidase/glutathione hydrolase
VSVRATLALVRLFGLVVALGAAVSCAPRVDETARGESRLDAGAVASPEAHATRVGLDVLAAGGNAVDAAVAVHFALAVTHPIAGNLGGGGFAVVHVPGEGEAALDFRETAPSAAEEDLFVGADGEVVPHRSLDSHHAVGVPGSVRGMWELHRRWGSMTWRELVEPARSLAEQGFELHEKTAAAFARKAEKIAELDAELREKIDFSETFSGEAGAVFEQPELAETLARLANDGPADFYVGETARLIVEEMQRGGGLITAEDLASYEAVWREPVSGTYRGHRIVSMPPPSSGGVALVQMLGLYERFEAPAWHAPEHVHLVAEIEKRVFADRAEHLGDPDFYDVPVDELISDAHLARLADGIALDAKTEPSRVETPLAPTGALAESEDTLHFSIVDAGGLAVSVTTTINTAFGTGIVVDGAGFLLNNEMDDFSAQPGVPNVYGVTGGEANKVEGRKRMLSSMSPTIVFDEAGALRLVLGTPGGPTIFTTVFQVVTNVLDEGMSIEAAVAAPRFHHQWPPRDPPRDPILVESAPFEMSASTLEALRDAGYAIEKRERPLGDVQAIAIVDGTPVPTSDPRGIGLAAKVAGDEKR